MTSRQRDFDRLTAIYKAADRFQSRYRSLACVPGCSDCCTSSVYLTGLEADYLLHHAPNSSGADVQRRRSAAPVIPPSSTVNGALLRELRGEGDPDGEGCGWNPSFSPCLFLRADGLCDVYPYRPLVCRLQLSLRPCRNQGYATADDELVAFGTLLMQLVEHLDRGGMWGALSAFAGGEQVENALYFRRNHPLPLLVATEEELARFAPCLEGVLRDMEIPENVLPKDRHARRTD